MNGTGHSIPGAALAAAADAISGQPAGTSAAHLARVAIEAAEPFIRRYDRTGTSGAAATQDVPVPAEVTADADGYYHARLGGFRSSFKTEDEAKVILGRMIAEAVTRAHEQWLPAFACDRAGAFIIAYPDLVAGSSLWRVTPSGAEHLGYALLPSDEAIRQTPIPHRRSG